jgi:hypothetical protein
MSAEMILCPHCGKENLPQATRCVHCGEDLEELFRIEGMEDNSALQEEPDISVADLLESFRNDSTQKTKKQDRRIPPDRLMFLTAALNLTRKCLLKRKNKRLNGWRASANAPNRRKTLPGS